MRVGDRALERSRDELRTPEWALHAGLRQVAFYNLARGSRDLKMLRGTRDASGALWELRHHDGRNPVRVLYRMTPADPEVRAMIAKEDEAQQQRMIDRVRGW
jgi:hypothetical protein